MNALGQQVAERRQCEEVEQQRHESFGEILVITIHEKPIIQFITLFVVLVRSLGMRLAYVYQYM